MSKTNLDASQDSGPSSFRSEFAAVGWVIGCLTLILYVFWILLGVRFSPDTYHSGRTPIGTVEMAWFGLAVVGALLAVSRLRLDPLRARRWLSAAKGLTAVSFWVLLKSWMQWEIIYLDLILFCAAFGWTILWGIEWKSVPTFSGTCRGGGGLLGVAAVALGVFYFHQQISLYNNLALGYSDFGEIGQLLHNTLHHPGDSFLAVNPDIPRFYDHFQPGILPFIPLAWFVPEIPLLVFFQVFATLICALPIYWIGKHFFQDLLPAQLLAAIWLVYPALGQFIYNSSYGFHWGSFCLPLYFFALAFWLQGRPGWAIAAALWALLLKEEAAILIGMFGIYLAIVQKQWRAGGILVVVTFGYFLIISSVVVPHLNHQGYIMQYYYSHLGHDKWEILLSPLTRPHVFWREKIFAAPTFYYAATLLAPLLFLPCRKPAILFLGSLTFLFTCLRDDVEHRSICFQYQAGLLPVLFWALAAAIAHDSTGENSSRCRASLLAVLGTSVVLSIFIGSAFWSKDTIAIQEMPGRRELIQRVCQPLDSEGTLMSTERAAAHVFRQKYLFTFTQPFSPHTDYVVYDLRDHWRPVVGADWLRSLRGLRETLKQYPQLSLVAAEDGLLFYARNGRPLDVRAKVERDAIPVGVPALSFDLGKGLGVRGATTSIFPSETRDHLAKIHVTLYSALSLPCDEDIAVRCWLHIQVSPTESQTYGSEYQLLGQGILPIAEWKTGKYYIDEFIIPVPEELSLLPSAIGLDPQWLKP